MESQVLERIKNRGKIDQTPLLKSNDKTQMQTLMVDEELCHMLLRNKG